MIAPLAKLMDWSAIQATTMLMPSANAESPRPEEALKCLHTPDSLLVDSQPAQVEFDTDKSGVHFRFPTPQPSDFAANNTVYGRLYRCRERWQESPVIVLLHGAGDFPAYHFRFPFISRRCNRMGLNVVTLVAPYHFQRRPRQLKASGNMDCLMIAKTATQAIAEIRALTGWLLKQGCRAVTLWGFSMGAWYAGMAVCCDARVNSVVMAAPAVRMNPWMEQQAVRPSIRRKLKELHEVCKKLNLSALNLNSSQPVIARDNILLIEGIHDLFVPKEDVEELWRSWGQPDIWRLPHGHIGVCCGFAPGLTGRVLDWLTPGLEANPKSNV
jgi:pimeloyl-ACP methyl ester carboxylesterase